jgi:hypothetical protein
MLSNASQQSVDEQFQKMKVAFELAFREQRKLSAFIKTCEGMCVQSDTALFKVKKRGAYIMLTDFESLCCLETRITDGIQNMLKMNCKEFTAKILLDSMATILRRILKNKHSAILFGDLDNDHVLQIKEVIGQSHRVVAIHQVECTENRARVYHVISTHQFCRNSQNYIQFRIPNVEFNKIITMQSIISGTNGGVGELIITPIPDALGSGEGDPPKNRCDIKFFMKNNGGGMGGVTIHTHPLSESVPVLHRPMQPIHTRYFLTYLKRSQNLFTVPSDFVTVYVSEKGVMVQTDSKDNHSVVIYTSDISDEDLNSYV